MSPLVVVVFFFFFSSRRRHTRSKRDWSSDVCSSDLVAIGTLVGGPLGDKIGRKAVIWGSIVGVLPFALMLPYANLLWTGVLIVIVGLVLASATSAIIVYALDLLPGRIGLVSVMFFGL